jgi:hypothetical protein
MKLMNLTITRNLSYESNPDQLKGIVQFQASNGKVETTLSPIAILNLLKVIQTECCQVAKSNAKELPKAFDNLEGELLLIDHPLQITE